MRTEGVRTLSLGPYSQGESPIVIDGHFLGDVDLRQRQQFRRGFDGQWQTGEFELASEKWHGCAGPVGDLFHGSVSFVVGTKGTDEETYFNQWVASNAQGYFRSRNGGVHRGGIMGENWLDLPVVADSEVEGVAESNLLLFGNQHSNEIWGKMAKDLPVKCGDGVISLADKTYRGDKLGVVAVFQNPLNPAHYAAVHGAATPDAICWGSHLDMQLIPDFLVYDGGEVLDWEFWDNDWRAQD